MYRAFLPICVTLAGLTQACSPNDLDNANLRPSLTMIRIGEAIPDDPPVIPDDHYLPGIQIEAEDYEYDETARRMGAPPPFAGELVDLSRVVDLDDPVPLEKHAEYDYTTGNGALLDGETSENSFNFDDVKQGAIGDCYLVAALSSSVYADSDGSVRDGLVRELADADGFVTSYAVRLYDAWGEPQDVFVDADLVRKNGKPTYARSMDSDSDGEEWVVSLFEKAYAGWHGGYQEVGDGGWAGDVMQAITGSTANYRRIEYLSDATILSSIENAVADNRPVVAGTWGKDDDVDYEGTNIYAWHAYSVLGVKRPEGEDPQVTLRNPWGRVEPAGNGPDDGIFDLPLPEFRRLYQGLTFGGNARRDVTAPSNVTDLATVAVLEGRASLSFSAPGDDRDEGLAASYDLRISTEPLTDANFIEGTRLDIGSPQAPGSEESVSFVLPDGAGPWYVALRVEDEAQNISALSNVLKLESSDPPVDGVEPTLFDFEGGEQGWATTGLFHRSSLEAVSGQYAMWMGQESTIDYNTGDRVEASLTSPVIDLTEHTTVRLMWESLLDAEASTARDQAVVEVATQAGGFDNWTTVWEKKAPTTTFKLENLDLSSYGGKQIQLRFRFDSVDASNNEGLGWFIDDVWIWTE